MTTTPVAVAGADDALDPREVGGPQAAVRLEGRVHRAFVAGHAALQTERERVHAVRGVVGDARDEPVRVGLGIELRLAAILEGGVDHAHVHEQALGGAAGIGDLAVEVPLAIRQGDARAIEVGSHRRTESENHGCHDDQRCQCFCHIVWTVILTGAIQAVKRQTGMPPRKTRNTRKRMVEQWSKGAQRN